MQILIQQASSNIAVLGNALCTKRLLFTKFLVEFGNKPMMKFIIQ